jgi:hypothetical protein
VVHRNLDGIDRHPLVHEENKGFVVIYLVLAAARWAQMADAIGTAWKIAAVPTEHSTILRNYHNH